MSFHCEAAENEYDVGEITVTKASEEGKKVVLVSSIDLCEPKSKNAILVQPEINPYYEERNSNITGDPNITHVGLDFDKITIVKNMYYA